MQDGAAEQYMDRETIRGAQSAVDIGLVLQTWKEMSLAQGLFQATSMWPQYHKLQDNWRKPWRA